MPNPSASDAARELQSRSAAVRRAKRDALDLEAAVQRIVDRAPALNDDQRSRLVKTLGGAK